jgi:hypothetical protein
LKPDSTGLRFRLWLSRKKGRRLYTNIWSTTCELDLHYVIS